MTAHLQPKQIGETYWLNHAGNWLAFDEPVEFEPHLIPGGSFMSLKYGQHINPLETNGNAEPSDDIVALQRLSPKLDWWDRNYIENARSILAASAMHRLNNTPHQSPQQVRTQRQRF